MANPIHAEVSALVFKFWSDWMEQLDEAPCNPELRERWEKWRLWRNAPADELPPELTQSFSDVADSVLSIAAANLQALLSEVGNPGTCRGCGEPIYWVQHSSGRKAPYTALGLNHFIDCPAASTFRKRR